MMFQSNQANYERKNQIYFFFNVTVKEFTVTYILQKPEDRVYHIIELLKWQKKRRQPIFQ